MTGSCTFTTPNPPPFYLPIVPVEVEINAAVDDDDDFISPDIGTDITPGNPTTVTDLNFVYPIPGEYVLSGQRFSVLVTGTTQPSSSKVIVSLTLTCEVGGEFSKKVYLNQKKKITVPQGYTGRCRIVATVSNTKSYASTFVISLQTLNSEQSAIFSKSVAAIGDLVQLNY